MPTDIALSGQQLRSDAAKFFDWSRFNLDRCLEKVDEKSKIEFESGELPKGVVDLITSTWSDLLKSSLSLDQQIAVVRGVLEDSDANLFLNTPIHKLNSLPKRIHAKLAKGAKERLQKIHSEFFAADGESRVHNYIKVSQSQKLALNKLIIQALGYKPKPRGGASIGATEIDFEQMMLREAEATGSAMQVTRLLPFLKSLWEDEKTIFVRSKKTGRQRTIEDWIEEVETKVVPNPDKSESRLNRFLIKLGRALANTKNRRKLPDWEHMDQTIRFITHGWCERITVDEEPWPRLCFFTTPALVKFLTLCSPQRWTKSRDPRALERAILRLGLIRISKWKIRFVEKKSGEFRFS